MKNLLLDIVYVISKSDTLNMADTLKIQICNTSQKEVIDVIKEYIFPIIIGSVTGILGVLGWKINKKNLYYKTMEKCTEQYRSIMRRIQALDQGYTISNGNMIKITGEDERNAIETILTKDLLGLGSEELFYIEKNYLPKKIRIEWISSLLTFIPLFCTLNGGKYCYVLCNDDFSKKLDYEHFELIKKNFILDDEIKRILFPDGADIIKRDFSEIREEVARVIYERLRHKKTIGGLIKNICFNCKFIWRRFSYFWEIR